jgi:hypothetical protein
MCVWNSTGPIITNFLNKEMNVSVSEKFSVYIWMLVVRYFYILVIRMVRLFKVIMFLRSIRLNQFCTWLQIIACRMYKYESRLPSSWTHLITPSRGTSWRCGDGLFFKIPPLASDAPLTTLHPLLENVLQAIDHFEISCLGAPFSWLEKPRNRMG